MPNVLLAPASLSTPVNCANEVCSMSSLLQLVADGDALSRVAISRLRATAYRMNASSSLSSQLSGESGVGHIVGARVSALMGFLLRVTRSRTARQKLHEHVLLVYGVGRDQLSKHQRKTHRWKTLSSFFFVLTLPRIYFGLS